MSTQIDPFSWEFIKFAASCKGKALEIGTAYGICALEALSQGVHMVCNDIDEGHLAALKTVACQHGYESRLQLALGAFPNELHFSNHTFDAILISRVLHLFDGDLIRQSLKILYRWLKPSGKLFVVTDTVYLKNFIPFIPIYEERVKSGALWPGAYDISSNLVTNCNGNNSKFPKHLTCLDPSVLDRELKIAGFKVEKTHFISRPDFPENRILDGREGVGAIAYKA